MGQQNRHGQPRRVFRLHRRPSGSRLASAICGSRAAVWAAALLLLFGFHFVIVSGTYAEIPGPPARPAPQSGVAKSEPNPQVSPATLVPSESMLVFRGNIGEVLGRSLSLRAIGDAVQAVTAVTADLLDKQTGRAILSSKVTVDPARAEKIEDLQRMTVTIDGNGVRPGSYEGEMRIYYKQGAASSVVPISLAATFEAVPEVSADANSVNQTLFAESSLTDVPYMGLPAPAAKPILGRLPIYLVQKGSGNAAVQSAEVLVVRGPDGMVLPPGTVQVSAPASLTLPPQGAKPLELTLTGSNVPAGDYTGNLRVHVMKQDAAIDVPFQVKVRDSWLYPMLVLLGSFIVGLLVTWYNGTAAATLELVFDINRRRRQLAKNIWHLQTLERSRAGELLALAIDAVQEGHSRSEAKQHIEAFDELTGEQAEKIQELQGKIQTLEEKIKELRVTFLEKVRKKLSKRIAGIDAEIRQGQTASLNAAQRQVSDMDTDAQTMQRLDVALKKVPEQLRGSLNLELAEDVDDIVDKLGDALLESIDDLDARVKGVEVGKLVRENLLNSLGQAMEDLQSQDTARLEKWVSRLPEIEVQVGTLEKVCRFWRENKSGLPSDMRKRLNEAQSLGAMEEIIEKEVEGGGQRGITPQEDLDEFSAAAREGVDFGVMNAFHKRVGFLAPVLKVLDQRRLESQPKSEAQSWTAYTFKMRLGVIAVRILVYVFALLVGWSTLYLGNPTFGARPEDYIALFLWGATVNIIGGQQIKIESILQHKTQQIPAIEK